MQIAQSYRDITVRTGAACLPDYGGEAGSRSGLSNGRQKPSIHE